MARRVRQVVDVEDDEGSLLFGFIWIGFAVWIPVGFVGWLLGWWS